MQRTLTVRVNFFLFLQNETSSTCSCEAAERCHCGRKGHGVQMWKPKAGRKLQRQGPRKRHSDEKKKGRLDVRQE